MVDDSKKLAIKGGKKVRNKPMPFRAAFGPKEKHMVDKVLKHYRDIESDPGYQGRFEELYCKNFSNFHGGGYSDAVATGTAAVYISLAALELPHMSEVLCSPITDPGTISAIILSNLKPKLIDAAKDDYNINFEEFKKRVSNKTSCVIVVHSAGYSVDIKKIYDYCKMKKIKLIEDCSQAHGAVYKNKKVGNFSDIAAFSTMYRKNSIAGSSGGVVYTKNYQLYKKVLAYADRGKPRLKKQFDDRNPNLFLHPALNFHTDEISCAIGISSLKRLEVVRKKRLNIVKKIYYKLKKKSLICSGYNLSPHASPFFFPVWVNSKKIKVNKTKFAEAIIAEGIGLNPHYNYVVCEWPWAKKYMADNFKTINALNTRNNSFNLYINENYGDDEVNDIVESIVKAEKFFMK